MNDREAQAKRALLDYIHKQGHDACWYYPDIFNELCIIFDIPIPKRILPPRAEFKFGCEKFRDEMYGS